MRIAVLADIHGNIRALEAVRADLAQRSADVVVNLGDHVSGPLDAAVTADLLMSESYIHIRGNHDRQVTTLPLDRMGASDRAAHGQLLDRHLAWLSGLPPTDTLEGDIFLCHGSPDDDLEYLLEDVIEDGVGLGSLPREGGFTGSTRRIGTGRRRNIANGVRLRVLNGV